MSDKGDHDAPSRWQTRRRLAAAVERRQWCRSAGVSHRRRQEGTWPGCRAPGVAARQRRHAQKREEEREAMNEIWRPLNGRDEDTVLSLTVRQ